MSDRTGEGDASAVPDTPVTLHGGNFDRVLTSHPLVVIDFWAVWCAPCRAIAPLVEQMAKEYAGKVVFGKLNVDEHPDIASRFDVFAIPTLLIIKNGREVDRIVGAAPKRQIEGTVKRYL